MQVFGGGFCLPLLLVLMPLVLIFSAAILSPEK